MKRYQVLSDGMSESGYKEMRKCIWTDCVMCVHVEIEEQFVEVIFFFYHVAWDGTQMVWPGGKHL